jgi:hypothetical protein
MSVTIDWNFQTDLTLLSGVEMLPTNNNDATGGDDKSKKKKASGKVNKNNNNSNKNIKIKKETRDNVIIAGNINSSMASAVLEARFLYLNRKPESFANVPVNPQSKQLRKRHCIRFVGNEKVSAACASKLPMSFFVSPTCASLQYATIIQQHQSQLSSQCTIVDYVNYENEWWIYAQSSKPTKTFIVCNFIYEVCGLKDGCFFTDEIPGGRDQIKRYEYTKLQHFKHCIRELQSIAYSQNNDEFQAIASYSQDNNNEDGAIEEQASGPPPPSINFNEKSLLNEAM